MRLPYYFLLFFLPLLGCAVKPAPAPETIENALLWRISGKDLPASSWLFGTIHMIGREDFFLTEPMQEHFRETEQVVFEIDLEEMNDIGVLMPLLMQAFMKGDTTLQDLLEPEEYELVAEHFSDMGLPMMFLDRIKPMFLSAMTSEDLFSPGGGGSDIVSYEMEFMEMAQQQDKEVGGLETAAFQMSMFDSIPYRVQARMLLESVRSGEEGDEQFEAMVALYKAQDLQGLHRMLQGDEEGISQYEDLLLVRRNRNWIPMMEAYMAEKPTFFAVGAGHLAGPSGVIALLRARGYQLEPVR